MKTHLFCITVTLTWIFSFQCNPAQYNQNVVRNVQDNINNFKPDYEKFVNHSRVLKIWDQREAARELRQHKYLFQQNNRTQYYLVKMLGILVASIVACGLCGYAGKKILEEYKSNTNQMKQHERNMAEMGNHIASIEIAKTT